MHILKILLFTFPTDFVGAHFFSFLFSLFLCSNREVLLWFNTIHILHVAERSSSNGSAPPLKCFQSKFKCEMKLACNFHWILANFSTNFPSNKWLSIFHVQADLKTRKISIMLHFTSLKVFCRFIWSKWKQSSKHGRQI